MVLKGKDRYEGNESGDAPQYASEHLAVAVGMNCWRLSEQRLPLALGAGLMAASAAAGAVGLATGLDSFVPKLQSRLPFHRPVFGAMALIAVVGLPYARVAQLAWRGDARTDVASAAAGTFLVAWIAAERVIVREPSVLNAICAGAGVAFVFACRKALPLGQIRCSGCAARTH